SFFDFIHRRAMLDGNLKPWYNRRMHVTIRRLPLKKLFNTRDLGGIPAENGKKIKHGKLIRSGKLYKIPQSTIDALKKMGVSTVIDLRIFTECEEYPDTLLDGVKYVHLPVLCTATPGITRDKSMQQTMVSESKRIKNEFGTADNYMAAMYKAVLLNEEPQKLLKQTLRLIIENEDCILWHCSGGKDRAGIVAMLVESLLGVSEHVIIQDYVASHRFQKARFFWNRAGLVIAPVSLRLKKILYGMMAAKPRYMLEAMNAVKEKYGSITEYCKQVLEVTDEDIELMKKKYLE
ncbi:MAG: tyrosine-protein phosphatase, partial [Clostridia bacterium]|nr:tyrosine-protein phosphatase [Clostridia bacterium]